MDLFSELLFRYLAETQLTPSWVNKRLTDKHTLLYTDCALNPQIIHDKNQINCYLLLTSPAKKSWQH